MASAASLSPASHSQRVTTERRRTLLWLLACVCCLALGSIASFASVQNAPERSWRVTTDKHVATRLELLQAEPSPRRPSKNHTTPDDSPSANASTGMASDRYDRGVVVSVHNGIVSMGVSLLRELRCLGNREVIQVYHCFPDELSPASQALLTRNDPNVEIVDVCSDILNRSGLGDDIDDVFRGDRALAESFRSYWLKPLALYHTKIREVVLLDADAVLMRDPASLRALSGYQRTGTTFFYDRVVKLRRFFNSAVTGTTGNTSSVQLLHHLVATFDYAQFGLDGPAPSLQLRDSLAYAQATAHEQDSSMVLVDKTRAGPALDVLRHLITRVRFELAFSWGDKEAFWLAFELAHQPYFFSPYGLSLLDSVPNRDLEQHPDTLCGSMAHFVPTEAATDDAPPELLYVNGKALLEPFPLGLDKSLAAERSRMFNVNPTHVTPRYVRRRRVDGATAAPSASFECLERMGATPLPSYFYARLLRRRTHFFAAETRFLRGLDACESVELRDR